MNLLSAIILGIVEGLTEFLPISSTGHLILASALLKIQQSEFLKTFNISIQLGAILAVIFLYWKSMFFDVKMIKRIITAFIPTAFIGFIFYKAVKSFLLGSQNVVLWSLLIGGIFIIIFELRHQRKYKPNPEKIDISYRQAFLIGVFQSFALVPGVSRSAATILGGLALGLNRKAVVEFSFLLAVPTMFCAVAFDLAKTAGTFTTDQLYYLAIGFVVSFITAILAIKFLLSFIQKNNFITFGVYRIILALIFFRIHFSL